MKIENLIESINKIQRVFKLLPSALYVYDVVSGKNLYSNHKFHELFGMTGNEENFSLELVYRNCHPDDVPAMKVHREELLNLGADRLMTNEFRYKESSRYHWLRANHVPVIRDENGNVVIVVGTIDKIDVERKYFEVLKKEIKKSLAKEEGEALLKLNKQLYQKQNMLALDTLELFAATIASLRSGEEVFFDSDVRKMRDAGEI